MDKIRKVAVDCIGRAVMFGAFAIGLVVISFSFELIYALNTGAILMLVMVQILIIKAVTAFWQNPRNTEVWHRLDVASRPAGPAGAAAFASILAEVYTQFAERCFTVACCFFIASVTLRLLV